MKYKCDVCGWEYDEAVGYPEGGIAPGTKWEDVPQDFECPLCSVGKDMFSEEQSLTDLHMNCKLSSSPDDANLSVQKNSLTNQQFSLVQTYKVQKAPMNLSDIPIRKHQYPTTHCKVCCRVHFCLFLQKKCCCKEKTRRTTLCNASVDDVAAAFLY